MFVARRLRCTECNFRLQDEIDSGKVDNPDVMDTKNEDKYEDGEVSMGGAQPSDPKQTVSVRNLRIREDTAKYLRNLDADSAYYDPKTRSMRENPYEGTGKARLYMILHVNLFQSQIEIIF